MEIRSPGHGTAMAEYAATLRPARWAKGRHPAPVGKRIATKAYGNSVLSIGQFPPLHGSGDGKGRGGHRESAALFENFAALSAQSAALSGTVPKGGHGRARKHSGKPRNVPRPAARKLPRNYQPPTRDATALDANARHGRISYNTSFRLHGDFGNVCHIFGKKLPELRKKNYICGSAIQQKRHETP